MMVCWLLAYTKEESPVAECTTSSRLKGKVHDERIEHGWIEIAEWGHWIEVAVITGQSPSSSPPKAAAVPPSTTVDATVLSHACDSSQSYHPSSCTSVSFPCRTATNANLLTRPSQSTHRANAPVQYAYEQRWDPARILHRESRMN